MKIGIFGAGSWGSALAIACSSVANKVILYSNNEPQLAHLNRLRNNPSYLPEHIKFADNIIFTNQTSEVFAVELLIIATPLNALRQVLHQLVAISTKLPDIFLVSKGFEAGTGKLPHEIINEVIPQFERFGLLIGPSFAAEVASGLPTAIALVAPKMQFAVHWMQQLRDIPNFRIYAHDDLIGSAVGVAIKNVMAIAVGISDGLKLGYNARAALITRSLSELCTLVIALGGKKETIYGLTGVGDLILTATGDLSRNRKVGQELAKGRSINEITTSLGHVAEGVLTTREIFELADKLKIDMPIVASVYRIIYKDANILNEVSSLLTREPRTEFN